MEKKTRVDNPELREFAYEFVPQKLNSNPLFIKIYGKDYAKKRAKANALAVYTNEEVGIERTAGYHKPSDKSVTLCQFGKDGALLAPEDVMQNEDLQELLVHEFIHAIFTRTEEECKEYDIVYGTGLLSSFYNQTRQGVVELGRGLNEGWTEWMCEQAGLKSRAYKELTDFVRLIETGIGKEATMELGNGLFCRLLQMPKNEVDYILAIADDVYNLDSQIDLYEDVSRIVANVEEKISGYSELYRECEEFVKDLKANPDFLKWLEENNGEISNQTICDYLDNNYIPNLNRLKNGSIAGFESKILETYFRDDISELFGNEEISENSFTKWEKIISFLHTDENYLPDYLKNMEPKMISVRIKEQFKIFKEKYIKQLARTDAQKYKEGKLGIINLIEDIKKYTNGDYFLNKKFINEFAENATPEFKEAMIKIIGYASAYFSGNDEVLKKIIGCSMYKVSSRKRNRRMYIK